MTNLEDLAAWIAKTKTMGRDIGHTKETLDAIYTILADYETRIAALEGA